MGSADIDHNITQEFLQKALGDESKILSYGVTLGTKPGDNFMSVIYSIDVKLEDKDGKESTKYLLIKCYPSHPARQEFTNKSNMFFKELEIYRTWMPELKRLQTEVVGLEKPLKLPYATYVYGNCIDFESDDAKQYAGKVIDQLDNFIIMEDLRKTWGFRMTNRRESMDLDHMRLIISELAKIHAFSWAYKNHVEKDIVSKFSCLNPNFAEEDKTMWTHLTFQNIDQAVTFLDEAVGVGNELSKACIRFKEVTVNALLDSFILGEDEATLEKLLRKQPSGDEYGKDSPNPEPWRIICHGDCWSNNMLFRYDEKTGKPLEVVLVDLQVARETCVVNDLVYVIYVCTRSSFRRNHLDELLQLYHDRFNEVCKILKTETLPGFNMDSFRFRFHRGKLLAFLIAMIGLPIMLKEAENAVNLESMDHDKQLLDMFNDVSQDATGCNTVLKERIVEITQELYDQGII